MQQSIIKKEDVKYVKFDTDGKTYMETYKGDDPNFSYRKVHYTKEDRLNEERLSFLSSNNTVFKDPEYQIRQSELENLIPGRKIVLKRLYDLYRHYPEKSRPSFFPVKGYRFDRILNHDLLPSFATEIGLFPVQHYRSLFITQEFTKNGLYQVTINQNGRWETDVVDDWIPVYEDSREPIWGMDFQHSWQIVLLKFWAKKCGGYQAVKQCAPFSFIQCFSNSNWKYFNIARDNVNFLEQYDNKYELGKFVLKTKNSDSVSRSGLIPNTVGYEILHIAEKSGKQKASQKKWSITIRSTLVNKWAGEKSVLDKNNNDAYNNEIKKRHAISLERDFVVNEKDFFNLFSACWVASLREKKNYYSNYELLEFPSGFKNSLYLEFHVTRSGWLDFCIKQHDDIQINPTNKSSIRAKEELEAQGKSQNARFLKCKFLLARQLSVNSEARDESWNEYKTPKWQQYEIEYLHGYNRGDARFENLEPGRYIFRIKPEAQNMRQISQFVINYTSNMDIELKEVKLTKKESSTLLRSSLTSMIGDLRTYSIDVKKKYEQICFANLFSEVGYAFVAVRSKKVSPYDILIQIDPEALKNSNLKCKNQFKGETQPFSITVQPGDSTSIAFKKINENADVKEWPPSAIHIFKKK